jgi:hypothetical protein
MVPADLPKPPPASVSAGPSPRAATSWRHHRLRRAPFPRPSAPSRLAPSRCTKKTVLVPGDFISGTSSLSSASFRIEPLRSSVHCVARSWWRSRRKRRDRRRRAQTAHRSGKNRSGRAGAEVGLPRGRHVETCPVRAFEAWQAVARRKAGPLFRKISTGDGIGDTALHPDAVRQILAQRAGLVRESPATKLDL